MLGHTFVACNGVLREKNHVEKYLQLFAKILSKKQRTRYMHLLHVPSALLLHTDITYQIYYHQKRLSNDFWKGSVCRKVLLFMRAFSLNQENLNEPYCHTG